MGKFDNLNDGQLPEILRRLDKLERATPMNNAAIGRGGFEVYDGGTINVSSGNLIVNGTATISGVLNADGTVTLSGTVSISGPLTISGDTDITGDLTVTGPTHLNGTTDVAGDTTVTGDFDVDGPMTTTGTLSVEGVTTLKNDLNVTTGGKVKAGNVTIDPSLLGGAIQFSNGGAVAASADFVTINSPDGLLLVAPLIANNGVRFAGLPLTASPANLYVDPSTGNLYRSTA